jgi:hypothetical protein
MIPNSVEGMIDYLGERGKFSLLKFADGKWHAWIEIPAPKGCTAKVASDFTHATHYEALRCVIERLDGLRTIVSTQTKNIR